MTFDYVVILKNKDKRSIDIINLILCGIGLIYLVYKSILLNIHQHFQFGWIAVIMTLFLVNFYIRKKNQTTSFSPALALYLIGLLFIFNTQTTLAETIFGVILLILAAFEQKVKANLEIGFSAHFIMFNNFTKTKYSWNDFNNIVIKDNILTLDFKSNRLFQRETIDEESDCDEDEFNEFCREQLAKNQ
ncbi:MAG TPA: hypothetical protein VFN30_11650 [Chitinophagaceae bacterium]|nr:hypothetical protein [Chitinophagaceae bacterium]